MRKIRALRHERFSPDAIFQLHRILTEGTLPDEHAAGRLRKSTERVVVEDDLGQVLHTPPTAGELPARLSAMCDFANGLTPGEFVHPVVRAVSLHFWLAYDHPFVDGNGRCARALFYWSMLASGYWLSEYISISKLIRQAPVQYGRAFLYTETDENDLTYFLLYHLRLIAQGVADLRDYVREKLAEQEVAQGAIQNRDPKLDLDGLNLRQIAVLGHALKHPSSTYTIAAHQTQYNVVYETARTDLFGLAKRRLFDMTKRGRLYVFTPVRDLERRLRRRGTTRRRR
jgi:Fic family protein